MGLKPACPTTFFCILNCYKKFLNFVLVIHERKESIICSIGILVLSYSLVGKENIQILDLGVPPLVLTCCLHALI